jgi:hypothetical protein
MNPFEIAVLVALAIIVFRGNGSPNLTALGAKLDDIREKLDDIGEKLDDTKLSADLTALGEKLDDIHNEMAERALNDTRDSLGEHFASLEEHFASVEKAITNIDPGTKLDGIHGELEGIALTLDHMAPREGGLELDMPIQEAAEVLRKLEGEIGATMPMAPRKGGDDFDGE